MKNVLSKYSICWERAVIKRKYSFTMVISTMKERASYPATANPPKGGDVHQKQCSRKDMSFFYFNNLKGAEK